MNVTGIVGALVGGVIGTLIWAAIAYFTGYELGYVAWAVGGLVGLGALFLGGRGAGLGFFCAVVALISIFGGKAMSMKFVVDKELQPLYEEWGSDAEAFAKLDSEDQYREFMVAHKFTEKSDAASITEEELESFKENWVPRLRWLHDEKPDFATWRDEQNISISTLVFRNVGLIDIVFLLLGIVTAFKIGMSAAARDIPELPREEMAAESAEPAPEAEPEPRQE